MAALTTCPPWLRDHAAALLARCDSGRLPHALLLGGIDGIGKRAFSQWLAEALLCRDRREEGGCGVCSACHQLLADSHPDFRKVLPEGANASIKVGAVRDLVEWLQLTASQGSYRVAVLEQADTMNRSAANGLLKTLEEPSDNAILILNATQIGALPATIRSRCQATILTMQDKSAAVSWLADKISAPEDALIESGGGPFVALQQQDDSYQAARALLIKAWRELFLHKGSVGRISDSLADLDSRLCLAMFSRWTLLAARQEAGVSIQGSSEVQNVVADTRRLITQQQWFELYERLLLLYRTDSASFKAQTVLEGLFADIRLMIKDRNK